MDKFPVTRYSVIARMRAEDPESRRLAYEALVEGYWRPVYKHLRLTWRLDADQAQELAQAFFTEAFEKEWLERFDPGRARFRTFVRLCVDRFVMNTRQAESRLKRGGAVRTLTLDFNAAERELAALPIVSTDPDARFQQEFVRALLARTIATLRKECAAEGRTPHFHLFERYDLASEDGVSYAQLASAYGLTTTQVTNRLAGVRRRFRELALDNLRALCGTDAEFEHEAREVFGREVR